MASILEELAYGNISPEAQSCKRDCALEQAMELVARNEQKLLERLSEDDKKVFEIYADMQGEVNQLTSVKNFVYGFKLGLMMTAEAFVGMDDYCTNKNNI